MASASQLPEAGSSTGPRQRLLTVAERSFHSNHASQNSSAATWRFRLPKNVVPTMGERAEKARMSLKMHMLQIQVSHPHHTLQQSTTVFRRDQTICHVLAVMRGSTVVIVTSLGPHGRGGLGVDYRGAGQGSRAVRASFCQPEPRHACNVGALTTSRATMTKCAEQYTQTWVERTTGDLTGTALTSQMPAVCLSFDGLCSLYAHSASHTEAMTCHSADTEGIVFTCE